MISGVNRWRIVLNEGTPNGTWSFLPSNLDLANIMGRADLDFEFFNFLEPPNLVSRHAVKSGKPAPVESGLKMISQHWRNPSAGGAGSRPQMEGFNTSLGLLMKGCACNVPIPKYLADMGLARLDIGTKTTRSCYWCVALSPSTWQRPTGA